MPDRYDILGEIGRGGMGVVYRARDQRLGREVAIKRLREELLGDEKTRERFEREARAVARLDNPHIVPVYDFGVEEGVPFLVMPYVEGPTLRERVEAEGPLSPDKTARLGQKLAGALEAAHEEGLVHRDVKSQNVLIDGKRPRLTDFGIARLRERTRLTSTGEVLGTPAYMSPEQLEAGDVDHRSDVYGLGAVLYECLSGRLPYEGENTMQLMYAIAEGKRAPLEETAPEVPSWLAQVVEKCLSEEPEERYESAEALAEALREGGKWPPGPATVEMPAGEAPSPPKPPMPSEAEMKAWPEELEPLWEALKNPETNRLDLSGTEGKFLRRRRPYPSWLRFIDWLVGLLSGTGRTKSELPPKSIEHLPKSIGRLENLEKLNLQRNALTELPSSIGKLKGLERLYLGRNALTELPSSIWQLANLSVLSLPSNNLPKLPLSISHLGSLEKLNLAGNNLKELPSWIGRLENLKRLNLKGNNLRELPPSIGRLARLKVMNLRHNSLQELPPSIGRLRNLQKLDLWHNNLTELPESIGQLTSLKKLIIVRNGLTELPTSIGHLESLGEMDLKRNALTKLPPSIEQLRNLRELTLWFNPLSRSTISEIESRLPDTTKVKANVKSSA